MKTKDKNEIINEEVTSSVLKKRKIRNTTLIEQFFKKSKIIYYKAKINNAIIFRIPYKIEKPEYKVDIHIMSFTKTNMLQIGFSCKLNDDKDYSKELLDLNYEIPKGRLSVSLKSPFVTYSHTFVLLEESNIQEEYKKNLSYCFYVLDKLLERNIIKGKEDAE